MLRLVTTLTALAMTNSVAIADCKNEMFTEWKQIGKGTDKTRFFTLTPGGAKIELEVGTNAGQLSWSVLWPNKLWSKACARTSTYDANGICQIDVKKHGVYRIYVTNKISKMINYRLRCLNG